jgi:hypothetical protein
MHVLMWVAIIGGLQAQYRSAPGLGGVYLDKLITRLWFSCCLVGGSYVASLL